MRNNLFNIGLLLVMLGCNNQNHSQEEKLIIRSVPEGEVIEKEGIEDQPQKKDTVFIEVFSAEVNHSFNYPKNLKSAETNRYDSLSYFYPDSSLFVKKWIFHNFLTSYNYPKDEYNDIAVGKIDIAELLKNFELRYKNAFETFNSEGYYRAIEFEEETYQKTFYGEKGDRRIAKKLMFCNVVGGTHAIVLMEIEYSSKMTPLVERIIRGTKPGIN